MSQTARRNTIFAVVICAAIALVAVGVSMYEYNLARKYRNALFSGYERSFGELNQFVGEIGDNLETGLTVGTPMQTVQLAYKVAQLAGSAKNTLTNLPLSDFNTEQIQKYLSQTGEYMSVLAKNVAAGKGVEDGQRTAIQGLVAYTKKLKASLDDIAGQYKNKLATFTDVVSKGTFASFERKLPDMGQLMSDGASKIEPYSSLVYDGALSDKVRYTVQHALSGKEHRP
jgi:germination protein YpeB